jgi:hypothetical protein
MFRSLFIGGLLAAVVALASYTTAHAQFGGIFGNNPPRPPGTVPGNQPPPPEVDEEEVPDLPQQGRVLPTPNRLSPGMMVPPPGSVQNHPLPPPPGTTIVPQPPPATAAVPPHQPTPNPLPGLPPGQRQPKAGNAPPIPATLQPGDEVVTEPPAQKIVNKQAVFSGLDKITGRIIKFDVDIGETVQFGALRVKPQACYTRPSTEAANTDAFVEVEEITLQGEVKKIFGGWMFAASPGLHAVEHPIYDVWLTDCKGPSEPVVSAQSESPPRPAPPPQKRAPPKQRPPQQPQPQYAPPLPGFR